jgi:hypothetical protein
MSVNIGDIDNPNNPVNKTTTWLTSIGFNNVLTLLLVLTMICGTVGLPFYVLKYIVPGHLKSIQDGTALAVVQAAMIGDNRLAEQGKMYERLITEDALRDSEVLIGLKEAINDLRRTFEDRSKISDQTSARLLEHNERMLTVIEAFQVKKNSTD